MCETLTNNNIANIPYIENKDTYIVWKRRREGIIPIHQIQW